MWQEKIIQILKMYNRPMTAREISEIIRPGNTYEEKAFARTKVSKSLRQLEKYKLVEDLGINTEKNNATIWALTKEE